MSYCQKATDQAFEIEEERGLELAKIVKAEVLKWNPSIT